MNKYKIPLVFQCVGECQYTLYNRYVVQFKPGMYVYYGRSTPYNHLGESSEEGAFHWYYIKNTFYNDIPLKYLLTSDCFVVVTNPEFQEVPIVISSLADSNNMLCCCVIGKVYCKQMNQFLHTTFFYNKEDGIWHNIFKYINTDIDIFCKRNQSVYTFVLLSLLGYDACDEFRSIV